MEIRWWKHEGTVEGEDIRLSLKRLGELLGQRTRLVAFTACSNLLGELTDIKGVVDLVRTKSGGKAKTIADCVAYAPHRRLEVERWAVDFAFFSYYKVRPLPPSSSLFAFSRNASDPICSGLWTALFSPLRPPHRHRSPLFPRPLLPPPLPDRSLQALPRRILVRTHLRIHRRNFLPPLPRRPLHFEPDGRRAPRPRL